MYIGLGSNLGDRALTIRAALRDLEKRGDVRVLRCSSFHETAPVGGPPGQGPYLNAVAELETDLSPHELLRGLQAIERSHGRQRGVTDGPRTLDLDLLLYRDRAIDTRDLKIPHPRMWERSFVMRPLEELCGPEGLAARWQTLLPQSRAGTGTRDAARRAADSR